MDMQNVSNLQIPEGAVRTIHDKNNRLLWGRVAYSTKYAGDTYQQTYSGKNLLNLEGRTSYGVTGSVNPDNTVTISGKATRTDGIVMFSHVGTLPAGTYTLSISKALPGVFNLSFASGVSARIAAGNTSATVTTPQSYTNPAIFFGVTNGVTYNETFKVQFVAGSTPDYDFEPYVGDIPAPNPDYPQEVQTVTGEQTVEVTGKNLIYTNPRTNEGITFSYNSTNGVTAISGTPALTYAISATNSVSIPAGTYTISIDSPKPFNVGIGTRNASNVRTPTYIPAGSTSVTITRTEPVVRYDIYVSGLTPGTYISDEFKLMLEQGSTATAYELYQSHSYTISLGSLEFRKIGDYRDYIYKSGDDWYVHKEVGVFALSAGTYVATTSSIRGLTNAPNIKYVPNNQTIGSAVTSGYKIRQGQGLGVAGVGWFAVDTSRVNFNTGSSTNPVGMLYYALETPTDTKITDATLVGQLNDVHEWLTRYGYSATVTGNLPIIIDRTNL